MVEGRVRGLSVKCLQRGGKCTAAVSFLFYFLPVCGVFASDVQEGKELFHRHCKLCHGISTVLAAPPLKNIHERIPDKTLLYAWVRNNKAVLAQGHPYFVKLYEDWNRAPMNVFPSLSDKQIDAIFAYVQHAAAESEAIENIDTSKQKDKNEGGGLLIGVIVCVGASAYLWYRWKRRNRNGNQN